MHKIVVVGLGYVGLPLAALFARNGYPVIGFDVDEKKIEELRSGHDTMGELTKEQLDQSPITFTTDPASISQGNIIILTVPTPVDEKNNPNLTLIQKAAAMVGEHITHGSVVVLESTVYPGVTEEVVGPIIEKKSAMELNKDFYLGYSPERVNPGDKEHTIDKILKIVAGSSPETTKTLKELYGSVVTAGIHVAPSIKVAEAAKVIENVQRDLNIALVNELAIVCDKLDINVHDVLEAAGTKWNFHKYTPGLVGGHCIGVDPYYLTFKAKEAGYNPEIILAGRKLNDSMHEFYADKLLKKISKNNPQIAVLGLTFKENCNDYRNSRSRQLIEYFKKKGCVVHGIDPWLTDDIISLFGCKSVSLGKFLAKDYDGVIKVIPHYQFESIDFTGTEYQSIKE